MMTSKTYPSVDLMKFILAFFIVGIHAKAITHMELHPAVWYFCNFATSYFFVASGFFLKNKVLTPDLDWISSMKGIIKFLRRILLLFLLWSLIYLPTEIYNLTLNSRSFLGNLGVFFTDLLVRGKVGWGVPLWYLHSSLLGGGLLWICIKRLISIRYSFALSFILFFIGNSLNNILQQDNLNSSLQLIHAFLGNSAGRLFAGFFLLQLGMLIAHYKEKLSAFFPLL